MEIREIDLAIYDMMVENTGMSILDSGGYYGRNYERNRKLGIEAFKNQDEANLEIEIHGEHTYVECRINIFPALTNALMLDDLCREYSRLECENWDSDLCGVSDSQHEWLKAHGFNVDGGGGLNTANGDSWLSQVLQIENMGMLEEGGKVYLLLQIHGGCDIRGGYTDAKLFHLPVGVAFFDFLIGMDDANFSFEHDGKTIYVMAQGGGGFLVEDSEGDLYEEDISLEMARAWGVTEDKPLHIDGWCPADF